METYSWRQRIAVWTIGLLLSALAGAITLNSTIVNEKDDFESHTYLINDELNRRLSTLDAVLTSLAGFHQASDNVSDVNFSTFANELLNAYPYIQSAMSLIRLDNDDRQYFVEDKRESGYYQFKISEMTQDGKLIEAGIRDNYLIINTMEPMPPQLGVLLGYDIRSDMDLDETIDIALSTGNSIASSITRLFDSNASTLIFKTVYQGRYAPDSKIDRIKHHNGAIAIEITAEKLLAGIVPEYIQMDIQFSQNISSSGTIYEYTSHNGSTLDDHSTGSLVSMLLPAVSKEHTLDIYGKPTRLTYTHQLVISNYDLLWVITAACLSFIIYIAAVTAFRQRQIQRIQEQELSDYAARAAFLEENTDPILRIKYDGEIMYCNDPGKKILAAWQTIIGSKAPDDIQSFVKNVLNSDRFKEMEVSTGNRHYTLRYIANRSHRHVNIYGRDDTEQIKFENDLLEAKKQAEAANIAKSNFMATISHEVRTPINGVLGMLELLLNTSLDKRQHKLADTARRSGTILLSLINDILDFSKLESNKFLLDLAPFDLKEIVDDAVQIVAEAARIKRISIHTDIPEPETTLIGDDIRIRQILINLLGNAVKFTEAGEINLEVSTLSIRSDKASLKIIISDTGVGITESALPTIFDNFTQEDASTTRKYGGTGLGLAITKQLVELMQGSIEVNSMVGKGSVFTVIIPVGSQQDSHVIDKSDEQTAASNTSDTTQDDVNDSDKTALILESGVQAKVLLAEDNLINQEVATAMLESVGCDVTIVEDGYLALEALKNNHFDLVLMDCQMPRMDGIEATRQVRQRQAEYSQIPIIALTADAQLGAREKCELAGMNDYLSKPFTQQEVQTIVEKWSPR